MERKHLENLTAYDKVILEYVLKKWDARLWTGVI
jgi:hypothetical protein